MLTLANILLDSSGRIRSWDSRAQRLFGHSGNAVSGEEISCLLADFDRTALQRLLETAAEARSAEYGGHGKRQDGSVFPAQLLITALDDGSHGSGYSLVVNDLTVRSQAQEQTNENDSRLTGIIQSAMDAIITVDENQTILMFNNAAEAVFGCPAAVAIGGPLDRFIPERYRAAHRHHIERFGETGVTTRRMGGRMALAGLRVSGEEFPIDASISQVTVGGRKLFTVILRDGTESRRSEAPLQSSYHALRSATDRLHGIIQSAMDAIITIDHDQRIVVFNEAAEQIFRCKAERAIGGPLERFIPERFRAGHRLHVERFGATRVSTRTMGARLQLFGLRADGDEFPIDASISQVTANGEKLYTVILRDITERVQSERALEESNRELRDTSERLHGIIDSAMDAVITVEEDQKVLLFNAAAEKIFLCPAGEAIGGPLDRFIPERFRAAHRGHIDRFGETGDTTRMMGARLVLAGLRSNGQEFPIDASISKVSIQGRKLFTVILRDVTERKTAQEALERSYNELREMSAAMNVVREAERTRIARELHDELAQWLTAIRMDVSWLSARLPHEQPHLLQRTDKMKQLVDTTVTAVRRIASDLRPVMLDDLGLMPSIEHLLHGFSERANIAVSLDLRAGEFEFHDPLATSVYRMVQEALTNVARHAQATEVALTMTLDETGTLLVRIRDNGKGLAPDPAHKSYGILGIKERAQTLGGRAEIFSPPEGGTTVEIFIPSSRYRRAENA